jgi:hypothetical protein
VSADNISAGELYSLLVILGTLAAVLGACWRWRP